MNDLDSRLDDGAVAHTELNRPDALDSLTVRSQFDPLQQAVATAWPTGENPTTADHHTVAEFFAASFGSFRGQ